MKEDAQLVAEHPKNDRIGISNERFLGNSSYISYLLCESQMCEPRRGNLGAVTMKPEYSCYRGSSKLSEKRTRQEFRDVSMQKGENDYMPHVSPVEVEKCLKGMNYPAKKEDLIKHAQEQGANQDVMEVLKEMRDHNTNRT
jgi:hypothetical protein